MKKFKFSLDTVLDYKNMILDELKREHGLLIAQIVQKEAEIAAMENECKNTNDEFNRQKSIGISVPDAISFKRRIHVLHAKIKEEYIILEEMQKREALKRQEVVAAKVETSSIDKLKEKHLAEYNKAVMKSEELFIEEFVSNQRAAMARA
ncbi:MAG: flagellar FliJ family protein [Oscillospiraceae bacterium]|nr:flagellar FliJ family protein [Oscillospiraceae bacterium]